VLDINLQEYDTQIERLKNFETFNRKKKYIEEYIETLKTGRLNYMEVYEERGTIYLDDELYSDKLRLAMLNVFEDVLKQVNADLEII
jgi:hypothetical protein